MKGWNVVDLRVKWDQDCLNFSSWNFSLNIQLMTAADTVDTTQKAWVSLWQCSQTDSTLQMVSSWHWAGCQWTNIDSLVCLAPRPFPCGSGPDFPRWTSPWWRCKSEPHCRRPASPCAGGHSGTASWTPCEISATWRCRWPGWWRCSGRCTGGRRAGTKCPGRACSRMSWPRPESCRASRVRRRGSPPLPASLSPGKIQRKARHYFFMHILPCLHSVQVLQLPPTVQKQAP